MKTPSKKTAHSTASSSSTSPASTTPGSGSTAPPVANQKPPPANANIPTPPSGFVAGRNPFTPKLPRLIELGSLADAIEDLKSIVDYSVLTAAAPPQDEAIAALDLANQWSKTRKVSAIWDEYASLQEGIAWNTATPVIEKLRIAFNFAVQIDPSLRTKLANLATFLGARQTITKKGVSTKAANKKAKAEGKEPIHGAAGKKRKKAADKAIVAAATAPKPTTPDPAHAPSTTDTTATPATPATPHS